MADSTTATSVSSTPLELPQALSASSKPSTAAQGPTRGASQLPVSRVNKLIKLDPDVRLCSKEAVFLIAKLTEGAVCRLTSTAQQNARLKRRNNKAVQYADLAQVVQSRPEWFFLQDVIRPGAPLGKVDLATKSVAPAMTEAGAAATESAEEAAAEEPAVAQPTEMDVDAAQPAGDVTDDDDLYAI
ncbi:hypothetical protein ACM66B_000460 [Microbotryomycetes sp. NB124-2]